MSQQQQEVLPAGSERSQGSRAQQENIQICKKMGDIIKTTLGPKGMDKLLVDGLEDVTVTNDGVTILREMSVQHPTAKMMVEVAKTQDDEVGDGTTTAVVLAGELLKESQILLDKKIHPTIICNGFRIAREFALEELSRMSVDIEKPPEDKVFSEIPTKNFCLENVAKTAMTGKGAESHRDFLATMVVRALNIASKEDIKIEIRTGGSVDDSELVEGIVMDRKRSHANMPEHIEDAKIAILDVGVEMKSLEMDAKIDIKSPEHMETFLDQESEIISKMVNSIIETKANVVISSRSIDDTAQHFLAKEGIFCISRANKEDIEKLAKATGGNVINNVKDLSTEDLGSAKDVIEKKVGDHKMTFISGCTNAKSVTLLIRSSTVHVAEETKRAVEDALGDVDAVLKNKLVVPGAGATEVNLSVSLRKKANQFSGRVQLAILAFAEALEVIPKALSENAGLDQIDIMAELKSKREDGESSNFGVNVEGGVLDAWSEGIIEPLKVKTQAINSATEVAIMILRVDDMIATKVNPNAPPQGAQQ